MQSTYFFSFRSPYSWLASLALKKSLETEDCQLELVPFFEPDEMSKMLLTKKGGEFPYRSMSDAKHRYILKDIKRLTKKFGIEHKWPIDPVPWWEPSHLGYLQAKRLGYGLPFFWGVYRARWIDAVDISRPDTIRSVCLQADIPEDVTALIVGAVNSEEIREEGAEILFRIYKEDIFGVPMFTQKRRQYWGIERLSDFLAETHHAPLTIEEFPLVKGFSLDFDHAGGCG